MAVNKSQGNNHSNSTFEEMNDLLKDPTATRANRQSTTFEKDSTMGNTSKAATATTETNATAKLTLSNQEVLDRAKAAGLDITVPASLVTEFVSALNPLETPEDSQKWILALAGGSNTSPMSMEQFIVESHRDAMGLIMHLAVNQGQSTRRSMLKIGKYITDTANLNAELDQAKEINIALSTENAELKASKAAEPSTEDIKSVMEEIFSDAKALGVADVNAVSQQMAADKARLSVTSALPLHQRRNRQVFVAPAVPERLKVTVQEDSFWESTAKAVATGVIVGVAVYGVITVLDHFFGDND